MSGPDRRDNEEQEIRLRKDLTERIPSGEPRDRVYHQGERPDPSEQHREGDAGPSLPETHLRDYVDRNGIDEHPYDHAGHISLTPAAHGQRVDNTDDRLKDASGDGREPQQERRPHFPGLSRQWAEPERRRARSRSAREFSHIYESLSQTVIGALSLPTRVFPSRVNSRGVP